MQVAVRPRLGDAVVGDLVLVGVRVGDVRVLLRPSLGVRGEPRGREAERRAREDEEREAPARPALWRGRVVEQRVVAVVELEAIDEQRRADVLLHDEGGGGAGGVDARPDLVERVQHAHALAAVVLRLLGEPARARPRLVRALELREVGGEQEGLRVPAVEGHARGEGALCLELRRDRVVHGRAVAQVRVGLAHLLMERQRVCRLGEALERVVVRLQRLLRGPKVPRLQRPADPLVVSLRVRLSP
mmetsp:Transcript_5056/g.12528  ORF Transcript_5056/g.12528 Transcript_5056/m.12528 type:complete len:245 (+) Transcript_5056:816-1550(+)